MKKIEKLVKELRKLETDLREVQVQADMDFQADRLKKITDDLEKASTQIHGGGTGNE